MQGCGVSGLGAIQGERERREREREKREKEAHPEPSNSPLRGHKLRCRAAESAAWLLMPD